MKVYWHYVLGSSVHETLLGTHCLLKEEEELHAWGASLQAQDLGKGPSPEAGGKPKMFRHATEETLSKSPDSSESPVWPKSSVSPELPGFSGNCLLPSLTSIWGFANLPRHHFHHNHGRPPHGILSADCEKNLGEKSRPQCGCYSSLTHTHPQWHRPQLKSRRLLQMQNISAVSVTLCFSE